MAKNLQVYIEYLNRGLDSVQTGLTAVDTGLRNMGTSAEALEQKLNRADQALAGMQRNLAIVAGVGVTALGLLSKKVLGVTSAFEYLDLQIEILVGKEKAPALLDWIDEFTAKTPYATERVGEFTKTMLALGASIDEITRKKLGLGKTLLQAASLLGKDPDQVIRAYFELEAGSYQMPQLAPLGVTREALRGYGVEFDKMGTLVGDELTKGPKAALAMLQLLEDRFGGLFARLDEMLGVMFGNVMDTVNLIIDKVGQPLLESAKSFVRELGAIFKSAMDDDVLTRGLTAAFQELVDQAEPFKRLVLDNLKKLIDYLRENPQALVNGMRQFLDVLKMVTAAVLALTAARAIIALITGLTTLAALFGGGGIGGAIAVVAGGAGLIWLFQKFREMLSGTAGELPGLTGGLGDLSGALGGVDRSTQGTITAQQVLRDEFSKNIEKTQTWIEKLGELAMALLELPGLQAANARTQAEREALEQLGEYTTGSGETITLRRGGPHGEEIEFPLRGTGTRAEIDQWLAEVQSGDLYYQGQPIKEFFGTPDSGFSLMEAAGMEALQQRQAVADWLSEHPSWQGPGKPGFEAIQQSTAELTQRTQDLIKGLPANKICVIKTRDGFLLMSGDDPNAKPIYDAFTASVQTSIPALEAAGLQRTSQPKAGDIVFLDRMAGQNTAAGGHAGLFYGYDEQGRPIVSGNKAGSLYHIESKWGRDFSRDPYTNQQGLFAFANPFSYLRGGTGYASEFDLATDGADTGLDTGQMDAAFKAAAQELRALQETQIKAAEKLVAATEAKVLKLQREAELTGVDNQQKILEAQATAYLSAYVDGLSGLIDSGTLAAWQDSFSQVQAANAALAEELKAQQIAIARDRAEDAERRMDIAQARAGGDMRGAALLEAEGLAEDAKQAMSDLATATDAPEQELYQLQAAAFAAVTALLTFATSLQGMDEELGAYLQNIAGQYAAAMEALQGGPLTGAQADLVAGLAGGDQAQPVTGGGFYSPRGAGGGTYDALEGDYFP